MNLKSKRRSNVLLAVLSFAITSFVSNADVCGFQNEAQSLFDGKSLSGWEGDEKYWRVENETIVGEIEKGTSLDHNTWLVWQGDPLEDFELNLRFRITGAAAANSGIQFRCQVEDINHVSGYQADLDKGQTWLGRIYDEHGRALLVERGFRVRIDPEGKRSAESFAPLNQYPVLFREETWNDYRIVAVGDRVDVYVNGTLFSSLKDEQVGEQDLTGGLAIQLHSGPETKIEFRDILLTRLDGEKDKLARFELIDVPTTEPKDSGVIPQDNAGRELNLGFEKGDLTDWVATGDAFKDQPVNEDGIASRWQGQVSNKSGDYFVGGFEIVRDAGVGTLTSVAFPVTHPYASFRLGGGQAQTTRVEILVQKEQAQPEVIFQATGQDREQMRQVVVDLRKHKNQSIAVRLVDENRGGWGHLNFDDFRFHDSPPAIVEPSSQWRSTYHVLLHDLVPNPTADEDGNLPEQTTAQMHVPEGFSVDVIAAEPKLHQPMAFTFDAKGRLWVVEGHSYPQKRPEGKGLDRILIFSDEDGDGSFETRKVFAEGLNLVSGMEVGYGGVWIGAAPELLFIPDADGDDKPDGPPTTLLDGFGFADTHETINSFMWGPDGWLYGNQGVFNTSRIGKPGAADDQRVSMSAGVWRYHPIRHEFEVFAHGGSNQWGLDYDQHGQIFMTHCRSFWGQGLTTHVMQGGHYWNQVNGGYASFVSSSSLPGMPEMKNYLLASARYGHGEGGAGKKGTRDVYGGHSHVGTMIYLGDNWPQKYRNHLFTHNLHGHQMNHQVNERLAGGYNTVHAGNDVLFCSDQQYIGVDLKVGPDGSVYISDWYDPRHCHNPNVENWDRGNGRIYRMQYEENFKPVIVNYADASEAELIAAQSHANDWHARTARRILSERSIDGMISPKGKQTLIEMATSDNQPLLQLRAIWTFHAVNGLDYELASNLLQAENEYVRAWTIQLGLDSMIDNAFHSLVASHAKQENSLFVRRYLASAITRLNKESAWSVCETLAKASENDEDRDLPLMIWHGLAQLMAQDMKRGIEIGSQSPLVAVRNGSSWYAAAQSDAGREHLASLIASSKGSEQLQALRLFAHALKSKRGLVAPQSWREIADRLYDSNEQEIKAAAETLGAAFADEQLFDRMRSQLASADSSNAEKQHALSILANDSSKENLSVLMNNLESEQLAASVLSQLSRYDDARIPTMVLSRLNNWDEATTSVAMELLSSRSAWANALLDSIAEKEVDAKLLTAYYANRMANLGDSDLRDRLESEWGRLGQSSAELDEEIRKTTNAYKAAPLWAFSANEGSAHFKKLCSSCHQPNQADERIAPKLEGTGSKGIDYVVENIINPNAVIGRDFQARVIVTLDGRVLTGLIQNESESAIVLKTANTVETISKEDIDEMRVSEDSFMPKGLLEPLNERERIELLKYIMSM